VHVAIVGCGYVGLELGRQLTPQHRVTGVRRSFDGVDAVADAGLEAVHADATDPNDLFALPSADVVVYAASAGADDESARETYVEGLRTVIEHFGSLQSPPRHLVYTSSTGVYGDHDGAWVDEETPLEPASERQRILLEAESIALEHGTPDIERTVVRFGGLYGPGRSPVDRYLEGPVSPGYVNLVHRDDAAGAIAHLLEADRGAGVVNVVDDEPVDRTDLAAWIAEASGEPVPPTVPLDERDLSAARRRRLSANKRVSNATLTDRGYKLTYPTFRQGLTDGLADSRAARTSAQSADRT